LIKSGLKVTNPLFVGAGFSEMCQKEGIRKKGDFTEKSKTIG